MYRTYIILLFILIVLTITASASPLDISVEEKINTTSVYTGSTFAYTTNVTGYVNVTNKVQEDIYDVWIPIKLVNVDSSNVDINPTSNEVYE